MSYQTIQRFLYKFGGDLFCLLFISYVGLWFSLWYTQGLWQQPNMVPATAFTDGHLITISVGQWELTNDTLLDLHTERIGWPKGLIYLPLMWPTILLATIVGTIPAFNYTYLYTPIFNAICGYILGRSFGHSKMASLLCALLVGWNPWVRETLGNGQFEQAVIGIIALMWSCALWSEKKPLFGSFSLAIVIVLGGLASPNCVLAGLLGLPILGMFSVIQRKGHLSNWIFCAVITVVAAILVNEYHSANFNDLPQFFRPRRSDDSSMVNVATLQTLFQSPSKSIMQFQVIHCTYLSKIPMYAFFVALISFRKNLTFVVLGLWMTIIALGPSTIFDGVEYNLPMKWIDVYAPILQKSGSYYRFISGASVALAVCAAGMFHPFKKYWLLVLGFVYILGDFHVREINAMYGHQFPLKVRSGIWDPELEILKGGQGAVFDLPLVKQQGCDKNVFRYLTAFDLHQRPYVHTMEPPILYRDYEVIAQKLQRSLDSDSCSTKIGSIIEKMNIGALVVHTNVSCSLKPKAIQCLQEVLGTPKRGKQVLIWDNLLP